MEFEIIDAKRGCATVLVKSIKYIFIYGIATFWIKFIGEYIWWLGIVLFAILALVIAVNILMYVVSTISMLLPRPKDSLELIEEEYSPASDKIYLVTASLIRCLKEVICVLYLV